MQKHVRDEFAKELPLLLDPKMKWSILFSMLERISLIRKAVRKALINLVLQPPIVFTDDECEHNYSQHCAGSASSQINSGSFVSTRFKYPDSR